MEEKVDFLKEISNYIFTNKYSRYNEELKRRETWDESIDRLENMHLKKYSFLSDEDKKEINQSFQLVRNKDIVPSMRSIQFGGKAVEAHNPRIFNCAVRHIDSLRSFSEVFYLLLCGCGVGLGISKFFLNRLPYLVGANDKTGTVVTYVLEDNIEGWSDSIEALLNCYFRNTPYTGRKIVFDYSRIRPKGSILKTGGGKAPGYKGLKNAHQKIKSLLDHIIEFRGQNRLRSVDAYDILMHCADAVLSGGIRRSATSVIFDKDDEDMLNAKTYYPVDKVYAFHFLREETLGGITSKIYEGKVLFEGVKNDVEINEFELEKLKKEELISWRFLFPHRARSNNSVLLLRDQVTKEEFAKIVERTKQFGEPGFVFGNHSHQLFNPCYSIDTKILTEDGWRTFRELLDVKQFNIIQDSRVRGRVENNSEVWDFDFEKLGCISNAVTNIKKTGENQDVFDLELSCRRKVRATGNHHFATTKDGMVQLKNLKEGQEVLIAVPDVFTPNTNTEDYQSGYLLGLIFGDGNFTEDSINIDVWSNDTSDGFLKRIEKIVSKIISDNEIKIRTNGKAQPTFYKSSGFLVGNVDKYRLSSAALFQYFSKMGITHKDNAAWLHKFNKDFKSGFVSGLFYADGHVEYNKNSKSISFRISQNNLEFLRNIQLVLQELGSFSRIYNLKPAGTAILPDSNRQPKEYYSQASFRLAISGIINCEKTLAFLELNKNNSQKYSEIKKNFKRPGKSKLYSKVKSITYAGKEDVYCLKEDNARTLISEGMTARRCFEIGFIPVTPDGVCGVQFCNLTSQNGRVINSKEKFAECVKAATIIGTLQAGYTNFPYLSKAAEDLTNDESLLGVSITGMMDNPKILLDPDIQREMAGLAKKINKIWAEKIKIKPAARICCIKPEGTSSLVLGTGSGIHPHHSRRYIRRVQNNTVDNVYKFFKKQNPSLCEPSVWSANKTDDIIMFPVEIPPDAIVKEDLTAIEHLKLIKLTQENWVLSGTTKFNNKPIEHNVSCTVIIRDEEWDSVINYLFDNRSFFAAVSLLPKSGDKRYPQAPMESIVTIEDEELWKKITTNFKSIDYTQLKESEDKTNLSQEMSCYGGACQVI